MIKNIILLFAISILYPQVNIESMRSDKSKDGSWHKVGFNFGFVSGRKSEVMNLNGAYRFDYKKSNGYSGFLVSEYNKEYEKEDGGTINIFTYKGFGHLRLTKTILEHMSFEIFIQKEFNDYIYLKDRLLFGGGLRFTKKPNEKMVFYLGSGIMYERELYSESENENPKKFKSTSYLNHTFYIGENSSMVNIVYFQWDVNDFGTRRILWDGILEFPFSQAFSFTMKINYRYDLSPINPDGDNYFTISNGIILNL